jgi:phosphomevalonate kinase
MIIKVPGKLMLAGEWGVLNPGNTCIAMPISKFIAVKIVKNRDILFKITDFKIPLIHASFQDKTISTHTHLSAQQKKFFSYCKSATEIALTYLQEQKIAIHHFKITITSDISSIKNAKPGLGSSAAVTVAIIKAILTHHKKSCRTQAEKMVVFKLATLSHLHVQKNAGSGFDIAASTWGTTIAYKKWNTEWLTQQQEKFTFSQLVHKNWRGLSIKPITLTKKIHIIVGFTGTSAKTTTLINRMKKYIANDPNRFKTLSNYINRTVMDLITAIKKKNIPAINNLITINRQELSLLAQESGVKLETPKLKKLIDIAHNHSAAAKFSGAGGGDCGIALCTNKKQANAIKKEWKNAGIIPLNMKVI